MRFIFLAGAAVTMYPQPLLAGSLMVGYVIASLYQIKTGQI